MSNKAIGQDIEKLFEWLRYNWPQGARPTDRQKKELRTIFRAAVARSVNKRLEDGPKRDNSKV